MSLLEKLHTETLRVHKILRGNLIGLREFVEELAPDGYMAKVMPRGQNEKCLFPKVKFNFGEFYNDIPVVFFRHEDGFFKSLLRDIDSGERYFDFDISHNRPFRPLLTERTRGFLRLP